MTRVKCPKCKLWEMQPDAVTCEFCRRDRKEEGTTSAVLADALSAWIIEHRPNASPLWDEVSHKPRIVDVYAAAICESLPNLLASQLNGEETMSLPPQPRPDS